MQQGKRVDGIRRCLVSSVAPRCQLLLQGLPSTGAENRLLGQLLDLLRNAVCRKRQARLKPVSYTHLTLPTKA